jgi:hypothetical protein
MQIQVFQMLIVDCTNEVLVPFLQYSLLGSNGTLLYSQDEFLSNEALS